MSGFLKKLEFLDMHPKLVKDFVVKSRSGGIISLSAILLSLILFLAELKFFMTTEIVEYMETDPVRNLKMRVNFDVTFPDLGCALVSLDAMDSSGQHQLDVLHDVFKQRLDKNGIAIGDLENSGKGTLKSQNDLLKEKQKAIAEGRHIPPPPESLGPDGTICGNCYGAGEEGQCCNSCEEVRNAYRRKGWQLDMREVIQCSMEGYGGNATAQVANKEGCNIYGHLEMPKVAGNMHFAPGQGLQNAYAHVHDLVTFTFNAFNISHKINSLSFGIYAPGTVNPLDGIERSLDSGTGMHQYFLKLVPTVYKKLNGKEEHSFRFSVTEHLKKMAYSSINSENSRGLLPGVFFNYDLSPLRVRIEERRKSIGHFITRIFAVIGGVFTVMGLVDAYLYKAINGLSKKSRGVLGN